MDSKTFRRILLGFVHHLNVVPEFIVRSSSSLPYISIDTAKKINQQVS